MVHDIAAHGGMRSRYVAGEHAGLLAEVAPRCAGRAAPAAPDLPGDDYDALADRVLSTIRNGGHPEHSEDIADRDRARATLRQAQGTGQ